MGFVKSPTEIAAMEEAMAYPRFVNAEMLSVVFESDERYLASILPPPFELTEATVRAMVGRWQSNCVADFAGGAIYLPVRVGDVTGEYVLAMYMTTDAAIIYGRDLFGEPKKQADTGLHKGRDRASGWVERGGVRIIELSGDLRTDHGPSHTTGTNFNIKSTLSCTGRGLVGDAIVTVAEFDVTLTAHRAGTGEVRLASTPHDPLGDIPVGAVTQAIYQEGDLVPRTRPLTTIPAAQFVPYAYGRMDDWSLLNTERVAAHA